jgi:hypothetical protein
MITNSVIIQLKQNFLAKMTKEKYPGKVLFLYFKTKNRFLHERKKK